MDYLSVALILFAIGVILLLAEVVLPTGGILVVASLLFFGLGVCIILARGSTLEAVAALGGLAIGLPVAGAIAVSAYKRLSLDSALSDDADSTAAGASDLDTLKNRTGRTVSPMRPSGSVEFEGKRIDAMTEGVMLDAGVWVRCVEVKGGKVIVRQIESPLENTDLTGEGPAEEESLREWSPAPLPPPPPEAKKPRDEFDDLDFNLR